MTGMAPEALTFHVPGEMVGKGRPRFGRGKDGAPRTYTDGKTVTAETWVRWCAVQTVGQPQLAGPLALQVDVVCNIPDSWSKRDKAAALAGTRLPTGKPDSDNLLKLIADSLNKVVWRDDSQLVDVRLTKRYGADPGATITIKHAGLAP